MIVRFPLHQTGASCEMRFDTRCLIVRWFGSTVEEPANLNLSQGRFIVYPRYLSVTTNVKFSLALLRRMMTFGDRQAMGMAQGKSENKGHGRIVEYMCMQPNITSIFYQVPDRCISGRVSHWPTELLPGQRAGWKEWGDVRTTFFDPCG
jgi:hypothetical protein